jgi:membrane-associated phospholipid phosphatase
MRTSEWIQGGFALILTAAAWLRQVPHSSRSDEWSKRRWTVTLLAAVAITAILIASHIAPRNSALRDWLAVPLLLIPYWQTGRFFLGPSERIQTWLIETDRRLLKPFRSASTISRPLRLALEYAYLSCYPLVPLGLAALYIAGRRDQVDTFWLLVLVPTYLCYATTPFFPALPPRSLPKQLEPTNESAATARVLLPSRNEGSDENSSSIRSLNLELLKYGSIHAISFPSAHMASSLGVALVLLHFAPLAGAGFLIVAVAIGIAAVAGGYHYAIDVLLGAALALIVFGLWLTIR